MPRYVAIICIVPFLFACSGEAGERGPEGAAGPQGEPGAMGEPGNAGQMGERGTDGERGAEGASGPAGPMGAAGNDGAPGNDGNDGIDGQNGTDGAPGLDGVAGPQGPQGPPGEPAPAPGTEATPPQVGTLRIAQSSVDVTLDIVGFQFEVQRPTTPILGRVNFGEVIVDVLPGAAIADLYQVLHFANPNSSTAFAFTETNQVNALLSSNRWGMSSIEPMSPKNANQQFVYRVKFTLADVTMRSGVYESSFSATTNLPSCVDTPCGCASIPVGPDYIQKSGLAFALPANGVEIDNFSLGTTVSINLSSVISIGRPTSGGLSVTRPLDDALICEFSAMTQSSTFASTSIQHADPVSAQFGFLPDVVFDLPCPSSIPNIRIYSDANGVLNVTTTIVPLAVEHTATSYDAAGSLVATSSFQWSYVTNDPTLSCN